MSEEFILGLWIDLMPRYVRVSLYMSCVWAELNQEKKEAAKLWAVIDFAA